MWSFGCIVFELLQYLAHNNDNQKQYNKEFQDLRFLFQGDSCFPLSPLDKQK